MTLCHYFIFGNPKFTFQNHFLRLLLKIKNHKINLCFEIIYFKNFKNKRFLYILNEFTFIGKQKLLQNKIKFHLNGRILIMLHRKLVAIKGLKSKRINALELF